MQTELCRYFLEGNCRRGNKCKYSHGDAKPITQVKEKKFVKSVKQYHPKTTSFIDLMKLEESQRILEFNQNLYDGDFFTCVRNAKNEREKELIQMLRRFQSSMQFNPLPQEPIIEYLRGNEHLEITIKFTPTIPRKQLPLIQHVAERYFLIFMIIYPEYPIKGVEFQLMNQSVEQHFRDRFKDVIEQIHHSCEHSLIRTYKQLDNYFDEVCKQIEERQL